MGGTATRELAGQTILTSRSLHRVVAALAREAARVPLREVTVTLADRAGELHATVTLPLVLSGHQSEPCAAQGAALRDAVIRGLAASSERGIHTVDVRFSGVHRSPRRDIA